LPLALSRVSGAPAAIWCSWDVRTAVDLHATQVAILVRGLKLLASGGRLVYSTCSLDPLQDEAVVAAALRTGPRRGRKPRERGGGEPDVTRRVAERGESMK